MSIETKYKKVIESGKRKAAVAKAIITNGNGKVTFNGKEYSTLHLFDRLKLEEPIRITKHVLGEIKFNATLEVRGGGEKGQIDAARIALSKGIVKFTGSEEVKNAFLEYDRNLLVADVRRKESRKPGDSRARAKRQTSYR